jgi:hypothetical protein
MSARQKLNSAFFLGNVVLASVVGFLFGSLIAGLIAFAVLVVVSINSGEIRMNKRR